MNKIVNKFVVIAAITLTGFATLVVADQSVSTLEGDKFEGEIISLNSDNLVMKIDNAEKKVATGNLSEISVNEIDSLAQNVNQSFLKTFVGDFIPLTNMALAGTDLAIKAPMLNVKSLKLSNVAVIVNANERYTANEILEQCAAKKYTNDSRDKVVVQKNATNWKAFSCALSSMDKKKLRFKYKRKKRIVKMEKVLAVFIGNPTEKIPGKAGFVNLVNGTKLAFKTVAVSNGKLTAHSVSFGKQTFELKHVGSVKFISDKIKNLSDLSPVSFKSYDMFNKQYPLKKNLSVSGRKLSLGNKKYTNGIGVHAIAEITYDIDGKFSKFVSLVGINDEASSKGSVVIQIIGDGKILKKIPALTRKGKPIKLNINVKDVKKLTIKVLPGDSNVTVGDHVDFVNAKLIK